MAGAKKRLIISLKQRIYNKTKSISDDLLEKSKKEVTIHDLDPLALTLLVDFSYTGEIVISEDNVQVSIIT